MKKLSKIIIEYPKITIAVTIFILSLLSIFTFHIKLGTELKGGIILQLEVPGYTVIVKTDNYSLLNKLENAEIYQRLPDNRYVLIVFSKSQLDELKNISGIEIEKVENTLPGEYINQRIKPVITNRINSLGISGFNVIVWQNRYIVIDGPITLKDQIDKILQLGSFEIKVRNETVARGSDIFPASVTAFYNQQNHEWEVSFMLKKEAAENLMNIMKKYNYDENISMIFEGVVIYSGKPAESLIYEWERGNPVTALIAQGFGDEHTYWIEVSNCSLKDVLPQLQGHLYVREAHDNLLVVRSDYSKEEIKNIIESSDCYIKSIKNGMEKAKDVELALKSGSLPVKLKVVSSYVVEPVLAKTIYYAILILAISAFLGVLISLIIRYKKPIYAIPIFLTMVMEVVITLGVAAIINWVIDLAAIVGLLMIIATGVDHQIVILDETQLEKKIKKAIKGAFFIIYVAGFTTIATISPLFSIYYFRGFAFTTILGLLIGIFITRPAYAELVEKILSRRL